LWQTKNPGNPKSKIWEAQNLGNLAWVTKKFRKFKIRDTQNLGKPNSGKPQNFTKQMPLHQSRQNFTMEEGKIRLPQICDPQFKLIFLCFDALSNTALVYLRLNLEFDFLLLPEDRATWK